ncbi:mechanosensitive ion channel protein [Kordiimonas sediminis]|uniref:Mechanosensitive ion channel protein n=1 Tax=Kordiimonas sediminis TaxID=1735581 RepID=A0A919ANE9_9PROT|nr:mechanosensitive ion channel domain-containing protein [Kordiimonas sediminis]GHF17114.1 mechanosensitive ion channel protein [Kordiimonas sediminis]
MDDLLTTMQVWLDRFWLWVLENILDTERLVELGIIIAAILISNITCSWIHSAVMRAFGDKEWVAKADRRFLHPLMSATMALILIWTTDLLIEPYLGPPILLDMSISLFTAWIVIRLAFGFFANRELARLISMFAWGIAALNIVGLLEPISSVLDQATLPIGETPVSALDILVGIFTLIVMIWIAFLLTSLIERQVKNLASVPPSAAVLIVKATRIILIAVAFLASLNASGIDLTALAVFGGALGVGIGFGLQKVVGNFISGLILLLDRSIKPGDVIETGGTYGTINRLAARYTSVITRDGTEFLIPNEDMITQPVTNWSHTHRLVRRRIPVQISYQSNVEEAMALMCEAAAEENRVLKTPEPKTLVRGFGADGIDLELRMWIDDPQNGVSNIASAVMLRIWQKFNDADIEFPFPQRVIHVKRDDIDKLLTDDIISHTAKDKVGDTD